MNHINFLERRTFDLKKLELDYLLILLISGGLLLSFILYGLIQKSRLTGFENQMTALMAEVEQLSQLKNSAPKTEGVPSQLTALLGQRIQWATLLQEISEKTPPSIWLKSLKGASGANHPLEIEGVSLEMHSIARFKDNLETLSFLKKVVIVSSKDVETEDKKRRFQFQIEGWFK